MSARNSILAKIKGNLDQSNYLSKEERGHIRTSSESSNLIPERGNVPQDQLTDLFCGEATRVNASISRVAVLEDVPEAVSAYLREHQLPAKVKLAPDDRLTSLPWKTSTSLMVDQGAADGADPVSVSMAFGGVAETGSLIMASGPNSPTSLNFLPLDHVVVLHASDIAGNYEAVWRKMRDVHGELMPRTVNWITGPSRTADIEQTLLLGAHGPQRLHIVIVEDRAEG